MTEGPTNDVLSSSELAEAGASGARWVALARVGIELTAIGSTVVLARLIAPADFGKYALVVIFMELSLAVPGEGIGSALVQRRSVTKQHLEAGVLLSLLVSAVLLVLALLLAVSVVPAVFGASTATLVELATPCFLFGAFSTVPSAVLKRRLAFRRLGLVDLTTTIVRCGATLALAIAGLNATALVLGWLAGGAVGVCLLVASAPLAVPRWRRDAIRELTGFGLPAATASVFWTAFRNGDYAVIGGRAGTYDSGLYWRAYQLAVEYPRKITNIMAQVAFPLLSRTSDLDALLNIRRRMTRLLTVVVLPPLACLVLYAPLAIPWLFGPAWAGAVVPAQILAAGGLASVVVDMIGPVLMAAGHPKAILGFGVAHSTVYLGAVFLSIPFGLTAVSAVAAGVHAAFVLVAYAWLLGRLVDHPLRCLWDDVAAALVSSLALIAVAWAVGWGIDRAGGPDAVGLVAGAALGTGVYLFTLRICFPEAWRDLNLLLQRVLPRVRLRRAAARLAPAGASSSP
jgi:O-antigen/teichoic acid export membrane protein